MSEENLRAMIAWLDPSRHPLYILLPAREYLRLRRAWGLRVFSESAFAGTPVPPPRDGQGCG